MYLYGQYCPVARASEILADRWTPLIVRELLAGVHRFNELDRGLPGISRALLVERLRRLERTGLVARRAGHDGPRVEYHLTRAGRELQRVIDVLGGWGARWAFGEPRRTELDPIVLLWWMRRRVHRHRLLRRRVVIEFEFRGERAGTYWLVLERGDVSVCLQHPRFDVDVRVTASIAEFYRVWLGHTSLDAACRRGLVRLDGTPALVRAFPHWFAWSPMAAAVRAAVTRVSGVAAKPAVGRTSSGGARGDGPRPSYLAAASRMRASAGP